MSVRGYLCDPLIEKDGSVLPASRLDVGASVLLAICLMFAVVLVPGMRGAGWDRSALMKLSGTVLVGSSTLLLKNRRIISGAALGIVSFRLLIGLIFIAHTLPMLLGTMACCGATYLLLKDR